MRTWIILFMLVGIAFMAKAQQYLPSSGPLSLSQIKLVMFNQGEITYEELNGPTSIAYLNSKSHLADKTAPFSLSDWYGYAPVNPLQALATPYPDPSDARKIRISLTEAETSAGYATAVTVTIYYSYNTLNTAEGSGSVTITVGNSAASSSYQLPSNDSYTSITITGFDIVHDWTRAFAAGQYP